MRNKKGNITIEACIYIPIMIMITVFFIYFFMIISYKANVDSVLESLIDNSTLYLNDTRIDIKTSVMEANKEISIFDDLYKSPLNYKIFTCSYTWERDSDSFNYSHNNSKINFKLENILKYLNEKINKNMVILNKIVIEVKLDNRPIKPNIEITIRSYIRIPIFDIKMIKLESSLKKSLVKPQDTIRNIDLMTEYLDKIIYGIDYESILNKFNK